MFERYTEKARRAIFFARYEASQFCSPVIDTEHLLLGVLRENKVLYRWIPKTNAEGLRRKIEQRGQPTERIRISVDLPLSESSKRVLKRAATEADRLAHKHIGTEHLFLALLDEEGSFAATLLKENGADAAQIREYCVDHPEPPTLSRSIQRTSDRILGSRALSRETVEIHGAQWNVEHVRDAVNRCHANKWHWHKAAWLPGDVAVERKTGRVSFDLRLADHSEHFELVKGGWKKDHCFVCRWELFEAKDDADHGTGYTNGHDWLCSECYTKFFERPDFFSSSYSDIT